MVRSIELMILSMSSWGNLSIVTRYLAGSLESWGGGGADRRSRQDRYNSHKVNRNHIGAEVPGPTHTGHVENVPTKAKKLLEILKSGGTSKKKTRTAAQSLSTAANAIRPGFTVKITGHTKTHANGFLFPIVLIRLRKPCGYSRSFVELQGSYLPLVLLESWRRGRWDGSTSDHGWGRGWGGSTFGWGRDQGRWRWSGSGLGQGSIIGVFYPPTFAWIRKHPFIPWFTGDSYCTFRFCCTTKLQEMKVNNSLEVERHDKQLQMKQNSVLHRHFI